ncbi:MAG: polysaccharide biosynthesis/export family protein [Candidatus Marinimicrobia bacterium]|nr:polysaccharide biosynthesis/export family protein [Candidatus Neomarinimicrobiota bacterium]
MKRIHKVISVTLLFIFTSLINAQSFGRLDLDQQKDQHGESETLQASEEQFAFEREIDPNEYILGPGDKLGLNILTSGNMTYTLTVTPTGDLFIPGVGVCHIAGLTLAKASQVVHEFIQTQAFPGVKTNLVLINVRTFKVQIVGAVNKSGFVEINPLERLSDVIQKSNDFHQLAQEFNIKVVRENGESTTINFLNFLREGDLEHNPIFHEGDKIIVPFGDMKAEGIVLRGAVKGSGYDIIEPNELLGSFLQRRVNFNPNADLESVVITQVIDGKTVYTTIEPQNFFSTELHAGETIDILWEKGVMVNGFVLNPGGFSFFPGYTAADYITMAGGNATNGNPNRCSVRHRDGNEETGQGVLVRRGDVIVVPRTLKDSVIGEISALQITVSLVTIYLTFLATTG